MKFLPVLLLSAAVAAFGCSPAEAYTFGYSYGPVTLSTDLGDLTSIDTGWYTETGYHVPGNINYLTEAGGDVNGYAYNDYFTFDIGALNGPIAWAKLVLNSFDISASSTFRLGAYSGSASDLNNGYSGIAGYSGLGSGTLYATHNYDPAQTGTFQTINLNAAFVSDVNGKVANFQDLVVIGGTTLNLSPSVPEPATWAMMVGGFGLMGATMRRRRPTLIFA